MRRFVFISLVVGLVWFQLAHADSDPCALPSVQKIDVTVDPSNSLSRTFSYFYQYYPPAQGDLPTIVHIPGGPGYGMILDWRSPELLATFKEAGVPENYGHVFFDPRSVGCNKYDDTVLPDESLTTENLASDIISVVQALGLKNYVIYGHSFGTALGTVVASRLTSNPTVTPPRSVVLVGVVGRATLGEEGSTLHGFQTQWEITKAQLDPIAQQKLRLNSAPPQGLSIEDWASYLEWMIGIGTYYDFDQSKWVNPLRENLNRLGQSTATTKKDFLAEVKKQLKENEEYPEKWDDRLWEVLECTEYADFEPEVSIEKNKIVPAEDSDPCLKREVVLAFDAKNYPIHAPIYYFQGTNDPLTPIAEAEYHLGTQVGAQDFGGATPLRSFVTINEAAHLRIGAYFYDCREALWKAFSEKAGDRVAFEQALQSCPSYSDQKMTVQ